MMWKTPLGQLIVLSLTFCFIQGTYNIYYGSGTFGGTDISTLVGNNVTLYAAFSVFSILSGSVQNALGPRICIMIGGFTYMIYLGSLWYYLYSKNSVFIFIGAVIEGFGASMSWAAAGTILMAYPTENQKGRFFGIFWILFNLGSLIAGFLPLMNVEVNYVTIGFLCLMFIGVLTASFLAPPYQVIREDKTRVSEHSSFSIKYELRQAYHSIRSKDLLLLFPFFFYSNFFYAYRLGHLIQDSFTDRTRMFNTVTYWAAQMLGAFTFGQFLDNSLVTRSKRGNMGLVFVGIFNTLTWIGCLILELTKNSISNTLTDLIDGNYGASLVLMLLCGFTDAMVQSWCSWILGAKTNEVNILSRYGGFYKAVQSAGAAVAWYISTTDIPSWLIIVINFGLFSVGLFFAYFATRDITDTNYHLVVGSNDEGIVIPMKTQNHDQFS
ncbi:hypothetical protein K7432_008631 [Basidiobolus ranarum]|uniref:MFS general substrate transporter n=1 Tax=Basidiobolus ranarum TaxID=34480 RepID=A0ABR2WRH7_9FUNG